MNYLEMVNVTSMALRQVLKEPKRSEALSRTGYQYRDFVYKSGVEQPAEIVSTIPKKVKGVSAQ